VVFYSRDFIRNAVLTFFFLAARKPQTGFEIKEKESVSQFFQPPPLDKQERWFPTLRKTIWVVSQHHDFVKVCLNAYCYATLLI
jgi:hypothetical protein